MAYIKLPNSVNTNSIKKNENVNEETFDQMISETLEFTMDGSIFYIMGVFYAYCYFNNIKFEGDELFVDELNKLKNLSLKEYKEKYPDKILYYNFFNWFLNTKL